MPFYAMLVDASTRLQVVFKSSSSRLPFRVPPGVLRRRSRPHTPHEWQWDPAWLGPGDRTTGDASWNAKMPQMGQNGSVCSNTRNGCFCCGSKVINDGTCYVGSSQASEGICPISRQLYQLDWSILSVYVLIVNVVKVMKVVNATGIEGMIRYGKCICPLNPSALLGASTQLRMWPGTWPGKYEVTAGLDIWWKDVKGKKWRKSKRLNEVKW